MFRIRSTAFGPACLVPAQSSCTLATESPRRTRAGGLRTVCYREPGDLDRLFHDVEQIAARLINVACTWDLRILRWFANVWLLPRRKDGFAPISFISGSGPSMVLIMRVVERFCDHANEDRVKFIDFGIGDAEYKVVLGPNRWLEANTFVLSPSLKGFILNCKRTTTGLLDLPARTDVAFCPCVFPLEAVVARSAG
jgi:hypothetical protein